MTEHVGVNDFVEAFWARGAAEGWSDVDQAVSAAAEVVGKPIVVREEAFLAAEPVCGFVATLERQHLVMISPTARICSRCSATSAATARMCARTISSGSRCTNCGITRAEMPP